MFTILDRYPHTWSTYIQAYPPFNFKKYIAAGTGGYLSVYHQKFQQMPQLTLIYLSID
jgi:hypothetical protein